MGRFCPVNEQVAPLPSRNLLGAMTQHFHCISWNHFNVHSVCLSVRYVYIIEAQAHLPSMGAMKIQAALHHMFPLEKLCLPSISFITSICRRVKDKLSGGRQFTLKTPAELQQYCQSIQFHPFTPGQVVNIQDSQMPSKELRTTWRNAWDQLSADELVIPSFGINMDQQGRLSIFFTGHRLFGTNLGSCVAELMDMADNCFMGSADGTFKLFANGYVVLVYGTKTVRYCRGITKEQIESSKTGTSPHLV